MQVFNGQINISECNPGFPETRGLMLCLCVGFFPMSSLNTSLNGEILNFNSCSVLFFLEDPGLYYHVWRSAAGRWRFADCLSWTLIRSSPLLALQMCYTLHIVHSGFVLGKKKQLLHSGTSGGFPFCNRSVDSSSR